jgi:hydrogenase maturation protease
MILIIGYGNPLRGDDALGPVAAKHLAQHYRDDANIHVCTVHQLTPELSEKVAAYTIALLIDARHREPAGQVFVEEVQLATNPSSHPFSHYVTPPELLLLARTLYSSSPRMFLSGITATAFAVGEPLSPPVFAALPILYEKIAALVQEHSR